MSSESIPFEGVEKRLVVQFNQEGLHNNAADDVRRTKDGKFKSPYAMTAAEWQVILDEARCEIISSKGYTRHRGANEEESDSKTKVFLLSESTLVVWEDGFLMKTCGRTTPFIGFRKLLDLYGLEDANSPIPATKRPAINWIAYSRLDFLHPDYQVWPHRNFQEEKDYFAAHFATEFQAVALPAGNQTLYAMFYSPQRGPVNQPGYAMEEVLMTNISESCVKDLTGYQNRQEQLSPEPQSHSVLSHTLKTRSPKHVLDEFWFDPCGYSANVLFEAAQGGIDYFSTHISPEPCTSYGSLELGTRGRVSTFLRPDEFNLDALVLPFEAGNVNVTRIVVQAAELDDDTFAKGGLRTKSALGGAKCAEDAALKIAYPAFVCFVEHYAETDRDTTASSSRNSLADERDLELEPYSDMVFLVG